MSRWGIKTRIALWFIVILLVTLTINLLVIVSIGEKVARDSAKDDLREIVKENIGEIHYLPGTDSEKIGLQDNRVVIEYSDGYLVVDDFLDMINGVATGIYSFDGKLLYGRNLMPGGEVKHDFSGDEIRSIKVDENTMYVYDRPVKVEGHESVWVRGTVNRAQEKNQLYRMYRIYVLLVPIMILIAVFFTYVLVRRALTPLEKIASETAVINWGSDLSHRIRVKSKDREIITIVEALNSMLLRLENSYSANKKFTSNISHDLRTPVAIISAQAEVALDEEMPDDMREAFEVIQRQGIRMNEILDALITYNRMENADGTYEMHDVALSDVVKNTCKSFRIMQDDSLSLKEEIQDGIVIKGNEALLHRLLENLLFNAFKYGGNEGDIIVSLSEDDDCVELVVSDEGVGIPEEEHEKIFEWMYQGESGKKIGGSGFGLFIVKTIAGIHNAEIHLDSTPGEGSTFTIVFER